MNALSLTKLRYSDEELASFKIHLLQKATETQETLRDLRAQLQNLTEDSEQSKPYGIHLADTNITAERDTLHLLIYRQQKQMHQLNQAIKRVQQGTYGICRVSGQLISKERLLAIPHTEVSIQMKEQQETRRIAPYLSERHRFRTVKKTRSRK